MPDLGQAIGGYLSRLGQNLQPEGIRMQQQAFQQQELITKQNKLGELAASGIFDSKSPEGQVQTQGMDPAYVSTLDAQSKEIQRERADATKSLAILANQKGFSGATTAALSALQLRDPAFKEYFKDNLDVEKKRQEQAGATSGELQKIEATGTQKLRTQAPELQNKKDVANIGAGARTTAAATTSAGATRRMGMATASHERIAGVKATAAQQKAFSTTISGVTKAIPAAIKAEAANSGSGQAVIDQHNTAALNAPIGPQSFGDLARAGLAFPAPSGDGWVQGTDGWAKAAIPDPKDLRVYDTIARSAGPDVALKTLKELGKITPDLYAKIMNVYAGMAIKFNPQVPEAGTMDTTGVEAPAGSDTGSTSEAEPAVSTPSD